MAQKNLGPAERRGFFVERGEHAGFDVVDIAENRAFAEKAVWHTVGIINQRHDVCESERIISDVIGTGSACSWKGRKLILTAKHVVDKAERTGLRFLLRAGDAIDWDMTGRTEVIESVSLPIERIVRWREGDLAAIVLRSGELDESRVQFCELPKMLARDETVSTDGGVLLIGHPLDQFKKVSEVKQGGMLVEILASVPNMLMGEVVVKPDRALSSEYDPERDILVRFAPNTRGLKPHGYSGAGVWCDPAVNRGILWAATPLLLGVQTHAYLDSGLLCAVRATVVRQFLEQFLP